MASIHSSSNLFAGVDSLMSPHFLDNASLPTVMSISDILSPVEGAAEAEFEEKEQEEIQRVSQPRFAFIRRCASNVAAVAKGVCTKTLTGVSQYTLSGAARGVDSKKNEQKEFLRKLFGSDDLAHAVKAGIPAATRGIVGILKIKAENTQKRALAEEERLKRDGLDGSIKRTRDLQELRAFLNGGRAPAEKETGSLFMRALKNSMKATQDIAAPLQPPLRKVLKWLYLNRESEFVGDKKLSEDVCKIFLLKKGPKEQDTDLLARQEEAFVSLLGKSASKESKERIKRIAASKNVASSLDKVNAFLSCGEHSVEKIIDAAILRAVNNMMWTTHDAARPHEAPLLRILKWLNQNIEPELVQEISRICLLERNKNETEDEYLDRQYDLFILLFSKNKLADKILNFAFPSGDLGLTMGANGILLKVLKDYMPDILSSLVQCFIFIKSPVEEAESKEYEEKELSENRHTLGVRKEHEQSVSELSSVLFDREIFIREINRSNVPNKESQIQARLAQEQSAKERLNLWRDSGVTNKIRHLEKVFHLSSKGMIQQAKEYLIQGSNAFDILKMLETEYGISPDFNRWLGEQIKLFVLSEDSLAKAIWLNIEGCTSNALFNMAGNVAGKVKGQVGIDEHRETGIALRALSHLAQLFKDYGSKHTFSQLSKALLNFVESSKAHSHPLHALPVPADYRDFLWNSLKTQFLPKVVFPYLKKMYGQEDLKVLTEEFDRLYSHAPGAFSGATIACQAIGQFVAEFTPHYMATENEAMAEMLINLDLVKQGLVNLNPEEKQNFKGFIQELLAKVGKSEDPNFKYLFKEVGNYTQAVTMKVFGNASQRIQRIEMAQPKILVKTVTRVLGAVGKYFERLLEVTDRCNKKHAYEVPTGQMLEGLGENRHPGVAADFSLSEEQRIKIEMQNFYVPFTERLLKFSGVNQASDLSLPVNVFELIKTVKAPEIFRLMLEKAMDKHTLNILMLKTLEPLNDALEDAASRDPELLDGEAHRDTQEQRALNVACGEAVKALVKMLPVNVTKVFLN